jgi:hypothetical protein
MQFSSSRIFFLIGAVWRGGNLDCGGPGLKIHVPKEHNYPLLSSKGKAVSMIELYNIFGVEKWISGFFRASGNQKSTFLYPRKVPPSGRVPCPLFLRPGPERPLFFMPRG